MLFDENCENLRKMQNTAGLPAEISIPRPGKISGAGRGGKGCWRLGMAVRTWAAIPKGQTRI